MTRRYPVCRVCGCTEDNACPEGCGWADGTPVCTSCAGRTEGKLVNAFLPDLQGWNVCVVTAVGRRAIELLVLGRLVTVRYPKTEARALAPIPAGHARKPPAIARDIRSCAARFKRWRHHYAKAATKRAIALLEAP